MADRAEVHALAVGAVVVGLGDDPADALAVLLGGLDHDELVAVVAGVASLAGTVCALRADPGVLRDALTTYARELAGR
jgi:hypothetical protein